MPFFRYVFGMTARASKQNGQKIIIDVRAVFFSFSHTAPSFEDFKEYVSPGVLMILDYELESEGVRLEYGIESIDEVEEDTQVEAHEATGVGFYYVRFVVNDFQIPTTIDTRYNPFW